MNFFQKSNVFALQSFIAILMGLSLSNIILGYYNLHISNSDILIYNIGIGYNFLFLGSLVFVIRFYHGNIRLLHESYERSGISNPAVRSSQFIDWLVVLIQTIIFSFLGLIITSQVNFQFLIIVILGIDTIWLFYSDLSHSAKLEKKNNVAKSCAAINGICFLLLLTIEFLYLSQMFSPSLTGVIFGGILIVASIFDYIYNFNFYFPKS